MRAATAPSLAIHRKGRLCTINPWLLRRMTRVIQDRNSREQGMRRHITSILAVLVLTAAAASAPAAGQELPWNKKKRGYAATQDCGYGTGVQCPNGTGGAYAPEPAVDGEQAYDPDAVPLQAPLPRSTKPGLQQDYGDQAPANEDYNAPPPRRRASQPQETFSPDEITGAGHRFFGNITKGLASVVEHTFQQQGRPNGYILGEEGGGAFVAGVRYGEGVLHTKSAGTRRVYWQGPSIGYDFGAEGSKTMILIYDMYSPDEVYYDYAGVGGQAYLVGGAGVTFLKSGHVTMAPIRSGLGLRLGANVGYLKFTRAPTWNPF
jgi:hypothetical protein